MKDLLLSMNGRITRSQYWLAMLVYIGLSLVTTMFGYLLGVMFPGTVQTTEDGMTSVSGLAAIPYLILGLGYIVFCVWSGLCVNAKRCHDRGRSAWFLLVNLIPFVGAIWYFVELGFLRGTWGPNLYGPDPLEGPVQRAPVSATL